MMSTETLNTLQTLPQDIHFCLFEFLDWPSTKAVRLTSHAFASILPKQQLIRQHTLCATRLYHEETTLVRRLDSEYWDAAEQAFLGNTSNYYYSSSHDPDLDAAQKRWVSSHDTLPCYGCLKWLPTFTSAFQSILDPQFTRGRSTLAFDLGGKRARDRLCIRCAIRRDVYGRGMMIKTKGSIVCLNCTELSDPVLTTKYRLSGGPEAWKASFCRNCLGTDGMKLKYQQCKHELRYGKYHIGMRRGKEYRMDKGRRLREEKGIKAESDPILSMNKGVPHQEGEKQRDSNTGQDENASFNHQGQNVRICPIMKELRLCHCSEDDIF